MAATAATPATQREYGGKDDVMVVAAQFVSEYYEKFTSALTVCSSMYGKNGRILVSGPATPGGVPTTYEGQTEIIRHFDLLDKYFGNARKACIRSVEAVMGALGCVVILVEGAIYTPAADTEFTTTFVLAPNDLRAATTIEFHIASEALRFVRVNKNNALPAASTVAASSMPAQQEAPAQLRPAPAQRVAPAPVKKVFNETEEEEARKATPPPAAEAPKERKSREKKERAPREKKTEEAPAAPTEAEAKKETPKAAAPAKEAAPKPQAEKKERDDKPRERKERAPREKKEKKDEEKKDAAPTAAAPAEKTTEKAEKPKAEKKETKKKEEAPKEQPKPVVEEAKVDKAKPWGNRPVMTTAEITAATQAAAEANKKVAPAKKTSAAAAASSTTAGPSKSENKYPNKSVVLRNIPKETKIEDILYYAEPFGKVRKHDRLGANHAIVEFRFQEDAEAMVQHKDFTMFKQPVRVEFFVPKPQKDGGEKKERPPRATEKKDGEKPAPAKPAPKSAVAAAKAAEAPKQTEKKERAPKKDRKDTEAKPKTASA